MSSSRAKGLKLALVCKVSRDLIFPWRWYWVLWSSGLLRCVAGNWAVCALKLKAPRSFQTSGYVTLPIEQGNISEDQNPRQSVADFPRAFPTDILFSFCSRTCLTQWATCCLFITAVASPVFLPEPKFNVSKVVVTFLSVSLFSLLLQ